jgi:SnoaL-like domain
MTDIADITAFYELSQAKARYCRALDTRDWTALAELMTADIEFSISDGEPDPDRVAGRDDTLAMLQSLVADTKTVHQVHMPEIDLIGDEAQVIWAMQDRAVWNNGLSVTGYGHYHERWVRQEGRWKIASVKLIHLIMDIQGAGE